MSERMGSLCRCGILWLLIASVLPVAVDAGVPPETSLENIINYRQYDKVFASSGQPGAEQLVTLAEAGVERVIYLAFSEGPGALPHEDKHVTEQSMEYVHIPVVWEAPLLENYHTFADIMRRDPSRKTLLHCQVNARASTFSFLYRVLEKGIPMAEAKQDLNSVWFPDAVWRDFIFEVLGDAEVSPQCEGCDWSLKENDFSAAFKQLTSLSGGE